MLIDVPRISDPAAIVRVELVDCGCTDGVCIATYAFDGKVVAAPWVIPVGRMWVSAERFDSDADVLSDYDLDLRSYREVKQAEVERFRLAAVHHELMRRPAPPLDPGNPRYGIGYAVAVWLVTWLAVWWALVRW